MKRTIFLQTAILLCIFILSLNAIAQKSPAAAKPAAAPALKLATAVDSMQYTIGAYIGQWILKNGFAVTNPDIFRQGLNDVLANKPLLVNAESIEKRIAIYQDLLVAVRGDREEKLMFDNLKGQPGVGMLPNGVYYTIIKPGTGAKPSANDSILVHIKGYLVNGSPFEDTYVKNTPYRITPSSLIPSVSEVLQLMPVGSLWRIFIPSAQAYGDKGISGVIPPHAAVIYEAEIVSMIGKPAGK